MNVARQCFAFSYIKNKKQNIAGQKRLFILKQELIHILLDETKLYDDLQDSIISNGERGPHQQTFTDHIFPLKVYEFTVKLVTSKVSIETSDGKIIVKEMESEEAVVQCYTKPEKPLGKITQGIPRICTFWIQMKLVLKARITNCEICFYY